MLKVLVAGGAGYIGSHTVHKLVQSGYDVTVIDDLSTGSKLSVPSNVHFHQANLLDIQALRSVFEKKQFDAVFHFAAKLSVPESFVKFDEYVQTNVMGTFHLLQMCREYNINRFIFSSTAAVYGTVMTGLVKEYDALKPTNPYGQTKQMAEQLIQSYASTQPEFKYHILRYFNVSGAELDGSNGPRNKHSGQLIMNLCMSALGDHEINVFGHDYATADGSAVRDYIHVLDLADAHLEAYKNLQNGKASDIWNCAYGRGYTVLDVIRAFEKANGVIFRINKMPGRQGDPAQVIASNERIMQQSAWRPRYNDLHTICKTTFDWVKSAK